MTNMLFMYKLAASAQFFKPVILAIAWEGVMSLIGQLKYIAIGLVSAACFLYFSSNLIYSHGKCFVITPSNLAACTPK